jgi:hypothetical protein
MIRLLLLQFVIHFISSLSHSSVLSCGIAYLMLASSQTAPTSQQAMRAHSKRSDPGHG